MGLTYKQVAMQRRFLIVFLCHGLYHGLLHTYFNILGQHNSNFKDLLILLSDQSEKLEAKSGTQFVKHKTKQSLTVGFFFINQGNSSGILSHFPQHYVADI